MGGGAVTLATRELKQKIAGAVCEQLQCPAAEVRFADNAILGRTAHERLSFDEAIRLMFRNQRFPYACGVFKAPRVSWDEHTGQGDAYFTWVYGCQAVAVGERLGIGRGGLGALLPGRACPFVGPAEIRAQVAGQLSARAGRVG